MSVRTSTSIHRIACLLLLTLLAGCGPNGDAAQDGGDGSDEPPLQPAAGNPSGTTFYGQEIWVTYNAPKFKDFGRRSFRSRPDAERLAKDLRKRVEQGEDIGVLAREWSNANGAIADGFCVLFPNRSRALDNRGRALSGAEIGALTPIVDWYGGFWFARRIPEREGRSLRARFDAMRVQRVKMRAIWIAYKGLPSNIIKVDSKVYRTRLEALSFAQKLLDRALGGENFADLARENSDLQEYRKEGGLVWQKRPDKAKDYWLRWGEPYIQLPVLEAAFGTEPGKVHPKVLDVPEWGVFLVQTVDVKLR